MLLASVIVLLVLRQIMPIAASLAGGGSLSTMGTMSRGIVWRDNQGEKARQSG
jgi:hypothetical protein